MAAVACKPFICAPFACLFACAVFASVAGFLLVLLVLQL
jgi:hypothetical protein